MAEARFRSGSAEAGRESQQQVPGCDKAIGLYEQLKHREGVSAARTASAYPGEFNTEHPNQVWLIDHSPADIWLVDDRFRLPLGRPTLTLVIDAYSRVCVGFYVSFGSPSRIQVAMALLNAFFPKAVPWAGRRRED